MELLASDDVTEVPEDAQPRPLAGIAERLYKEASYSTTDTIPKEKRLQLDDLMSKIEFTYMPDCNGTTGVPAYFFTDKDPSGLAESSDRCYFYYNGIAEVHEYGKTYYYSFDFEILSKCINDILFDGPAVPGISLECASAFDDVMTFSGIKSYQDLPLSDETKKAIFDYFSYAKFRKAENGSSSLYVHSPVEDCYKKQHGFIQYSLKTTEWQIDFCENGMTFYKRSDTSPSHTYYLYDSIKMDSAIRNAIPELSESYPPFGTFYKIGNAKVNGTELTEAQLYHLSFIFFGFNWNETLSENFRDEEPAYTITSDVNNGTLIIRTYTDGTLEYKDEEGQIHTYDKVGCPENFEGNFFDDIQCVLDDTGF
jgi:hypothetical protein